MEYYNCFQYRTVRISLTKDGDGAMATCQNETWYKYQDLPWFKKNGAFNVSIPGNDTIEKDFDRAYEFARTMLAHGIRTNIEGWELPTAAKRILPPEFKG